MPTPILVRTEALPFAGDTWAADGSQAAPTAGLELLCTASPVLWKITGYSGTDSTAVPVTDTLTTIDARLVMRDPNPDAVLETATTTRLTDGGAPERPLGTGLIDRDIAPGQRFFCGLVSVTHAGPTAAVRIVITSGAKLVV